MIITITGAGGSGKSEYAEMLACRLCESRKGKKIYLATMHNVGREAKERIERHKRLRSGKGFHTVEAPYGIDLSKDMSMQSSVLLLECMSNLVANLQFDKGMTAKQIIEEADMQLKFFRKNFAHALIVTNEIFSDGNHYDEATQHFIKILGEVNQRLVKESDAFCEVVYGIPVYMKGVNPCQ